MKALGSTEEVHPKLLSLSAGEDGGIPQVEVKFVDMGRTTGGEGGPLARVLTLRREGVGSEPD